LKVDNGQLPVGWTKKKFGEIAILNRGQNPPKSEFVHKPQEGYVRFYQIRDGNSDDYEVYVRDTPQIHKVEPEEILMVAYRHIGRVFRGAKGAFNVALCKISNKDRSVIDDDYLFYIIPTEFVRGELMKQAERSLIPSMSVKHLAEITIPVPPLAEQKKIVEILDEAFEGCDRAIRNTEKNLANAQELFKSYLNAIFTQKGDGWEIKQLDDLCENLDSKRIPITKSLRESGDIPYYGASGIVDYVAEYIFNEDLLLISEDGANLLARTYPIAFSITGKTWVNNHAHVLRFYETITQRFVEYYLNSISLKSYISGMAQPKLNQKALNSIPIPILPLLEQKEIIFKLDELIAEIQRLETIYRQKLAALKELKQSILQKAFTGELTADKEVA